MSENRTIAVESVVTILMPSAHLPPSTNAPFYSGLVMLLICIYSTLYDHPLLPLFRLLAAIPATYFFFDVGWSPVHKLQGVTSGMTLAMGSMATLGIMRVLDVCFVRLWDGERPRWILKRSWAKWKKASRASNDVANTRKEKDLPGVLPLPSTLKERLIYTIDLFTSVQGASWYGDRVWDFAPPSVVNFSPPPRWSFVGKNIFIIVMLFFALDVVDTCVKTRTYDDTIPNPVTSLPMHLQILATIYTAAHATLPMNIQTRFTSILGVMLFNASPSSWPPITGHWWNATSLSEFWINWHHLFRRCFHRLSMGCLYILPARFRRDNPRIIRNLRRALFFTFSTLVHVIMITTFAVDHRSKPWLTALAIATFRSYCSQPLGLGIEKAFIFPIANRLPNQIGIFVRRLFAIGWLLWTSRWWADVWVAIGMFDEKPILLSPLRGFLYGKWVVE